MVRVARCFRSPPCSCLRSTSQLALGRLQPKLHRHRQWAQEHLPGTEWKGDSRDGTRNHLITSQKYTTVPNTHSKSQFINRLSTYPWVPLTGLFSTCVGKRGCLARPQGLKPMSNGSQKCRVKETGVLTNYSRISSSTPVFIRS